MKSLARWGSLPLLGLPLGSWALGLGEIETNSYLNQPLNAEIPFTATPEELATLTVELASVDAFVEAGLDYPAFLSSIEFEIGLNDAGQNVIFVTSNQTIAEPFVTMMVNVSHARGGFVREYSVLLDPPLFLPEEAQPESIAAPVTRAPEPAVAGGQVERAAPAPAVTPAPQPQAAPQPQPSVQSQAQATLAGDYTVQAGDTLWGIATQIRPAGVSINQTMISIFEANPAAFNGNINILRRGAILRIPPASELDSIAAATATAEVQRQIDAWRGNADATPSLVLLPPGEDAPAAGSVSATDAAAQARVEALEGQVANLETDLADTEAELSEAQRLLELRSEELADLQRQLEEAPAAETTPEAAPEEATEDLAEQPLFADEAEAAAEEAAEPDSAPEEAATTAPPIVPQQTEPSLVDRAIDFVRQPIVWGGAGAFALVLLALAFLRRRRGDTDDVTGQWEALEAEIDEEADHEATARIRAQAEESDMVVVEGHDADATAEERQLDGTAEIAALDQGTAEIEAPDPGTAEVEALLNPEEDQMLGVSEAFAEPEEAAEAESVFESAPEPAPEAPAAEQPESPLSDQTLSSQTVINLDQADPIAEADFHMAYGLYDQAADLITKALSADPDNRELKLKLLEVYFVWGNKEQFLEAATSLNAEMGGGPDADWDKVVIMGKQICPDEPIFAEATAAAGEVDLDLEASTSSAGLDFPFESEDEEVDLDLGIVEDEELSLAASGLNEAVAEPQAASAAVPEAEAASDEDDMLDIGERTQAGLEAALLEDTDDEGEQTVPGSDYDDLEATMESPTVSTEAADFSDALTVENPTIETEGPDAPTVESPTIEAPSADDISIGDTVEQVRPAASAGATAEMTAELEIDDLGLDVGDLDGLQTDVGDLPAPQAADDGGATVEQPSVEPDDDMLSATGVTQVLDPQDIDIEGTGTAIIGDDEATMMAPGFDPTVTGTTTEVLEQPPSNFDPDPPEAEDDLDLNLDDFSSALEGGETIEQPVAAGMGGGLDLDVGANPVADDEPTGTEEVSPLDPQTMTEVGTKLDLARAYIDMGDPEGAKSILEEVLSEGDTGQRSEAQALIDALPG